MDGHKNGDGVVSPARTRPRELARQRPQSGAPRLQIVPGREGPTTDHTQTGSRYCDEGLLFRKAQRKKRPGQLRVVKQVDDRADQVWTMDCVSQTLIIGRSAQKLTTITVMDSVCQRIQYVFIRLDDVPR